MFCSLKSHWPFVEGPLIFELWRQREKTLNDLLPRKTAFTCQLAPAASLTPIWGKINALNGNSEWAEVPRRGQGRTWAKGQASAELGGMCWAYRRGRHGCPGSRALACLPCSLWVRPSGLLKFCLRPQRRPVSVPAKRGGKKVWQMCSWHLWLWAQRMQT